MNHCMLMRAAAAPTPLSGAATAQDVRPGRPVTMVMPLPRGGTSDLSWSALSAVKGTPQTIVDKLEAAMTKTLNSAETRQRMETLGIMVPASGARPCTEFGMGGVELCTRVIKTAGIKAD